MATANIKAVITAEDKASPVVSGFGSSVGKMAGAVAIGTLAVQGFSFAMEKLVEAGKFALDSASDFEQNRIAFETMLGSADAARKMLKEVSDFAAKTPFELPEVVTGAKQLLAYNIEAGKIIPTFNALGNIAAGVGKDKLPQLILAFGQVRAAGHLTGMELRQFTEAGVPLLDMLAKNFGKTAGEIQDMVSEGKIGFPDVEKAIFGMSQEGGKFFNLMQKQSLTFGGVVSNLSDNIGRVAREIMGISDTGDIRQGSIFYYLSKGANELLAWLDAHKDQIVAFVNNIFEGLKNIWIAIQPALQQLGMIIQTQLMPALQEFWDKNQNWIIPALQALGVVLGTIVLGAVLGVIYAIKGIIWVITEVITFLGNLQQWFSTAIDAIKTKVTDLKDHFWENVGFIIGFFALLPAKLLFYVFVALQGVLNYLIRIDWGSVFDRLGRAWSNIWNSIPGMAMNAFNFIRNIDWAGVVNGVNKGIVNGIAGLLEGVLNGAMAGLPGAPKVHFPRFAKGVENFGGGMAIVGERGPELVNLPRGSDVIPNNRISSGSNTTININVGLMTGSAIERREAAAKMFEDLKDIASQRGQTVSQMIGAV